jgi:hypothetical protein
MEDAVVVPPDFELSVRAQRNEVNVSVAVKIADGDAAWGCCFEENLLTIIQQQAERRTPRLVRTNDPIFDSVLIEVGDARPSGVAGEQEPWLHRRFGATSTEAERRRRSEEPRRNEHYLQHSGHSRVTTE